MTMYHAAISRTAAKRPLFGHQRVGDAKIADAAAVGALLDLLDELGVAGDTNWHDFKLVLIIHKYLTDPALRLPRRTSST
jgi:hypothetical protein